MDGAVPGAEIGDGEHLARLRGAQRAEGERAVLAVENDRWVDAPVAELGAKEIERGRAARLAIGEVCAIERG